MCGTNRRLGRILLLFRRFQLIRGSGRGRSCRTPAHSGTQSEPHSKDTTLGEGCAATQQTCPSPLHPLPAPPRPLPPSPPSLRSFWGLPGGSLREGVTPYSVPCKKPPERAFGWPRVVSDKPTLGPDTSAVLVVLSGRMVGACALALTALPPTLRYDLGSAKCVAPNVWRQVSATCTESDRMQTCSQLTHSLLECSRGDALAT